MSGDVKVVYAKSTRSVLTVGLLLLLLVIRVEVSHGLMLDCPDGRDRCERVPDDVKAPESSTIHDDKLKASKSVSPVYSSTRNLNEASIIPASISTTTSTEDPRSRALNFNIMNNNSNNLPVNIPFRAHNNPTDLSDVSINDNDEDTEMPTTRILITKTSAATHNVSGSCVRGGLTYDHGEKLEEGCESICTCHNGRMECTERCPEPYFQKGKNVSNPLCVVKNTEDVCCSTLSCTGDTETEPLEICHSGNVTYNRGETFYRNCSDACICEAAGKVSCKPRCPPVQKSSDHCVELPDPEDGCCVKIFCDVNNDEHEMDKDDDMSKYKIISAKFINSTTVALQFSTKVDLNASSPVFVDTSSDYQNWRTARVETNNLVTVKGTARFVRLQNSDDTVTIENVELTPKFEDTKDGTDCIYKGHKYKLNEEFNDNCTSLCVCRESGMKCLKLECPTYFGVDVLDPNCIEWETIPPNFTPEAPNCCPESLRCKRNDSCTYNGIVFDNWQQIPSNLTDCDKRCYCEIGNIECQSTCPPVPALPPTTLNCPTHHAIIGHKPDDDCCLYWICNTKLEGTGINETNVPPTILNPSIVSISNETTQSNIPSKGLGPIIESQSPDGPLFNTPNSALNHDQSTVTRKKIPNKYDLDSYLGPSGSIHKKNPLDSKTSNHNSGKPSKSSSKTKVKDDILFVTPPPASEDHIPLIIETPQKPIPSKSKAPPHKSHQANKDDILQFISQHPEFANYPSGSVFEIHKPNSNQESSIHISNTDGNQNSYSLPQDNANLHIVNGGLTLEQILQELHKQTQPTSSQSVPPNRPFVQGPYLHPSHNEQSISQTGGDVFNGHFSDYQQGQDEIVVQSLDAVDAHTIRLAFTVPAIIVGLHGRVEVRYTSQIDDDINTWEIKVFAPPNDLIATRQLEFDLIDLKADTEYQIKVTVTLRDLHNTPSSRIYKIRTPKESPTPPPMIPIEPELAITDINATWVTIVWRKFTAYELQFIDGVQLRYKEIDGKVYDATALIHRSVTSYTLENLRPNTKYEIGIFFIPFQGQFTELHAGHMLHFTTANQIDTYGFNVTLDIAHIKTTSVEISWSGVPYPEDKYVNIYRAIYQSDTGKEDHSTFKIAKRDSPTKTLIMDLKPGTRYRLWLEVYLTNGKIKTSNVQDFITKPRAAPVLGSASHQGGVFIMYRVFHKDVYIINLRKNNNSQDIDKDVQNVLYWQNTYFVMCNMVSIGLDSHAFVIASFMAFSIHCFVEFFRLTRRICDKLLGGEGHEIKADYYGPLVIVAILASIAIISTLVLLLILVRRHNQNKACITPPTRISQSAYDNPTYKVEIQQETMGL